MSNEGKSEAKKEAKPAAGGQAAQKNAPAQRPMALQRVPVGAFPATLEAAKQMAVMFVRTGMYRHLDRSPDVAVAQAFVIIQKGMEMGLPPARALQDLVLINGHMSIRVESARAMVQQTEQLVNYRVEEIGQPSKNGQPPADDWGFRVTGCRRSEPDKVLETRFTVAQAKTAKLWGKKGKDGQDTPWITYPDRMLRARAEGFFFRDHFADLMQGHLLMDVEAQDISTVEAEGRDLGDAAPDEKVNQTLGAALAGRPAAPEACPEALGEDGAYDEQAAEQARERTLGKGPGGDVPTDGPPPPNGERVCLEKAGRQPKNEPVISPGRVRNLLKLMTEATTRELPGILADAMNWDASAAPAIALETLVKHSCSGKSLPQNLTSEEADALEINLGRLIAAMGRPVRP